MTTNVSEAQAAGRERAAPGPVSPVGLQEVERKKSPGCRHCGAPLVDERMRASGFCCAGCSYVYRLVHEHGLEGYYRLKDDITTPADAAVFQARDYTWLEAAQRETEAVAPKGAGTGAAPTAELALSVQGISCVGCVWLIERIFQQQAGAREIIVNAQYGSMRIRWKRDEFRAGEFARRLQAFGYLVGPAGAEASDPESRSLVKRIGLCAAFAMNVMLFTLPVYFGMTAAFEWARLFSLLNAGFATLSFLVGGSYFLGRAVRALRERALHIDLPIALGIMGAYAGSLYGWLAGEEQFVYFDFVSAFILLMLVGRWAQVAAVERNRRRLLAQQPLPPRLALIETAGGPGPNALRGAGNIAPEEIRPGHAFWLASGQTLPVESRLECGPAQLSLASINGEADPRLFLRGERIPAGAVNLGREPLHLVALQPWRESLLAQLLAPGSRPVERHRLLERIVRGYLIGIILVAAGAGLGWWLVTADGLRTWSVVTAVLVVSCPCAVALAFPLADEMATVALRRRGVFVREADLWARLARVKRLVFDKTGTLTLETPVLRNPGVLDALSPGDRGALLALVRDNAHPVSECLRQHLLVAATPSSSAPGDQIREEVGQGVWLGPWSLGRAGWRDAEPVDGATVFACDGRVRARLFFADEARADARVELATLAQRGWPSFILSGDRQDKVDALTASLGLPASNGVGDQSPAAKAAWLEQHGAESAMMLGDGANDSLAFDRALCRGTPVIHRGVLERKADFYYLGRGIGGLRALFDVDARRRRTQGVILVFSIAYNVLAVGLAVAGRMNPLVAAALMPINSLLTLVIVTVGMRPAFRA